MSKTHEGFSTRELKRIFSIVFAAYLVLTVAFYFLAGEQLRFRESRGDIELPAANAATVELTAGSVLLSALMVVTPSEAMWSRILAGSRVE